jgi:glycosyltransferase involved in cell wall biosynthesis
LTGAQIVMTTPGSNQPTARVRLMAWLRGQPWLRSAYRSLPEPVRERTLGLLTQRLQARTRFPRTAAWDVAASSAAECLPRPTSATPARPGVNIIGYIHGQFGLAEAARSYARVLIEHGVPVALVDVDLDLPHSRDDHTLDAWIDPGAPHAISIIFVNPDYLEHALRSIGQAREQGRYLIACWFWELEKVPDRWLTALDLVDEVLVATSFVEQAVRRVTDKPVLRVPMPLGALNASGLQRHDFGLPDDAFVFLTSFDFSSLMERKNPEAVLRAFRQAFPPERSDVCLLIKSSNGYRFPHLLRHLMQLAQDDGRILIRDEVIEREHLNALHDCCDAYVSLHRAEGFGIGMAESMALGKPVIATGWSGNMEFMDAGSAALVDYTLVPLREGAYPDGYGQRWAEADIEQAAGWMRRLADDPAFARDLGQRARDKVKDTLSGTSAAQRLVGRMKDIEAARYPARDPMKEHEDGKLRD